MGSVSYTGTIFKGAYPTRPETMPGAAKTPPEILATKEMFDPTTFVPREKEGKTSSESSDADIQPYLKPGYVPWRIFCSATTLLLTLWWSSGVLVLFQASGWHALRVAPLLHDTQGEGPAPIDEGHGSSFLLTTSILSSQRNMSLLQMDSVDTKSDTRLLIGQAIETHWPHLAGSSPRRLACGMDADGKLAFAAASRFGLFTSQLEAAVKGKSGHQMSTNRSAVFQYAPPCDDLDGEALQDVSMACGGTEGHCQAFVLHRQGQKLAACDIAASKRYELPKGLSAQMALSDSWLDDGDAAAGHAQEEVASLIVAGRCFQAEGQCAFAETSRGRLVELKTGLSGAKPGAGADFFPTRVLLADDKTHARDGGSLHIISSRYIGLLAKGGTELQALDPQSGGKVVGRWPLPYSKHWTSMCSTAGNIYLLGEDAGQPPQIFEFPLPSSLHSGEQIKPSLLQAEKGAAKLNSQIHRGTHRKQGSSKSTLAADA